MEQKTPLLNIPLAVNLMQKSSSQVLEQCEQFKGVLVTHDDFSSVGPDFAEALEEFESLVYFHCMFECSDYQAFSLVSFRFVDDVAVECVVSLGRPANLKRHWSELEVTKKFLLSLEESYHNGRIQEEDELGTRVYTWKRDNRTEVSFISYIPSYGSTDTGALLSVQIRDTQLHPQGREFELLYNEAQKRVEDLSYVNLHRNDEPLEKVYERRGARYHLTSFLFISAIILGIVGVISLVRKDFTLGIILIVFAALCAFLMSKLHNRALRDYREKRRDEVDSVWNKKSEGRKESQYVMSKASGTTWKPTVVGILCIISGCISIVIGVAELTLSAVLIQSGLSPIPELGRSIAGIPIGSIPLVVSGIVSLIGGIFALGRRFWRVVWIGVVLGMASNQLLWGIPAMLLFGIPAAVFLVLGSEEFRRPA